MDEAKQQLLKKKLKIIKTYKGQGTQLISLFVPPDADRSTVMKQLTDEMVSVNAIGDDSISRLRIGQWAIIRQSLFRWIDEISVRF